MACSIKYIIYPRKRKYICCFKSGFILFILEINSFMQYETQERCRFYAIAERICSQRTSEKKFINNAVLGLSGSFIPTCRVYATSMTSVRLTLICWCTGL